MSLEESHREEIIGQYIKKLSANPKICPNCGSKNLKWTGKSGGFTVQGNRFCKLCSCEWSPGWPRPVGVLLFAFFAFSGVSISRFVFNWIAESKGPPGSEEGLARLFFCGVAFTCFIISFCGLMVAVGKWGRTKIRNIGIDARMISDIPIPTNKYAWIVAVVLTLLYLLIGQRAFKDALHPFILHPFVHNLVGALILGLGYCIGSSMDRSKRQEEADQHFNNATTAHNEKHFEKAVTELKRARTLSPKIAEVHYNLARSYAMLEQIDSAKESLGDAIKLDPRCSVESLREKDFQPLHEWLEKEYPVEEELSEKRSSQPDVVCPYCGEELELDNDEIRNRRYRCPFCEKDVSI